MMTISTTQSSVDSKKLDVVLNSIDNILEPWEVLCGLTDVGGSYVPDICCKRKEDFMEHQDEYMDAPTPLVNKFDGKVHYAPWNDEELNRRIERGKYIKLQDKPSYTRE